MNDTNFIGGIVKILETPKQDIINNNIFVTSFRVQFPQVRSNYVVHLKFWGNLARDVSIYYQINDYILIEGYLSLINQSSSNLRTKIPKKIEITVLKIYPFLLNSNRTSIGMADR